MGDEWKKRQRTANQLIDSPRPNSEPPRAPLPQSTEKELDEWGETLRAWQEENKHIPNLPDPAMVVDNFKKRMAGVSQKPGVAAIPPSNAQPPAVNVNEPQNIPQLNTLDAKVQALEVKLDRILSHFGVK
jgi:hypothetical protein